MSVIMGLKTYLKESYTELVHKVTWPTWSELQNSAVLVMVATVIVALIVALMDFSFSNIMEEFYKLLFK
jgi:preprotein translocase subunit SecE